MTWLEALVTVLVAALTTSGVIIPVYLKLQADAKTDSSSQKITSKDLSDAQDPDSKALAAVYRMEERLSRVETQNEALAVENRLFRGILSEVVRRMKAISNWSLNGHIPPAPYTPEEIIEYIWGEAPHLRKEDNHES